jgi:ABC-type amino acid transport substrate-binding protein
MRSLVSQISIHKLEVFCHVAELSSFSRTAERMGFAQPVVSAHIKALADKLGVKPRLIEAISDNRIPFLERGTVDLILSTMTINAERDMEIDFSEPYYIAQGRILVPKGSDIKGLEDLTGGTSVCTALGSTYEETIREEASDAELRLVDTYS